MMQRSGTFMWNPYAFNWDSTRPGSARAGALRVIARHAASVTNISLVMGAIAATCPKTGMTCDRKSGSTLLHARLREARYRDRDRISSCKLADWRGAAAGPMKMPKSLPYA